MIFQKCNNIFSKKILSTFYLYSLYFIYSTEFFRLNGRINILCIQPKNNRLNGSIILSANYKPISNTIKYYCYK